MPEPSPPPAPSHLALFPGSAHTHNLDSVIINPVPYVHRCRRPRQQSGPGSGWEEAEGTGPWYGDREGGTRRDLFLKMDGYGLAPGVVVVPRLASCRGGGGGGDAVVLHGPAMRAGTCEGGTSSRAQPCIWTQRELSIQVSAPLCNSIGGVCVLMKNRAISAYT